MKRDLDYYLNLPYRIEIEPIAEEDGGGFAARIPELGRYTLVGDGQTIEEAVESLQEIKEIMFQEWIEKGIPIPEPETEPPVDEYSGKFVVRIPRHLHRDLAVEARNNGVSLNQFVAILLAAGVERHRSSSMLQEILSEVKAIKKHLFEVRNRLDSRLSMEKGVFADVARGGEHDYLQAA
jgi:predicted HicB family RNase H-like nuclease